ncbi:MAG: F0F1 ATP synthase subunit delta [Bacteroidia bacterium]
MASSRIASRYSKSLLELAKEANALDAVKEDMMLVMDLCANSKELANLLKNPIVKAKDKSEVLTKIFSSCNKSTTDFIQFLVMKKREAELPLVAEQYIQAYDSMKGIARATVTSAIPLSDETLNRVRTYVQGLIGTADLELTNNIDASIIGGMIVRHEDKLLDMSVAKELREIRKELIFN